MAALDPKPEWRPSSGDIRSWGDCGLALHRVRMAARGPGLPTLAAAQVGSYLGDTGRGADVVATAALDLELPFHSSIL